MLNSGIEVLFEGINMQRLFGGLLITARIAFISIILGSFFGIILGLVRTSKSNIIRWLCRLYLEVFRIIPILVWLFIVYFGVTVLLDIHLDGELVAVLVFSLWGAAEMSDIVRGALESLPKHQIESGKALGLSFWGLYRYVLIPQAVRRLLPGAMNLSTRMIKTTSLVVMIGVIDVVKVGQQIIERSLLQAPTASFWVYGFIFLLYFIICYPLSRLSKKLETKWES
ncbi:MULTISPECIES: amino acid ABC transporter permease [Sporomusa]|jgi:polar amino acid transport system permease protein|uniref:Glutamine ABC transporter permease protein GlnP n=2 Tax=Sporomusa TaxID=2375 RepID=A0ABM9VZJ9_9FIRM|nr:amino acid ABC transporter permease [Sporomusa sphaeroides]MCM0760953.1 amino acid ABC transporter permease [Sporomusa sphaeroides DSM 2875]OLS57418.1 putative glutamine ABC transporter permease protein GlnP [Sporomusa sphaeroides DSM 2875]CVK18018.1 putative glutamine ABC transporter permease protein GlnP [Sporomusa sphaeroides DSM 2875]SCM81249.1 Polar amino acid ABC transporter, inner membrane subunit [uncultured Sporomusa sp.]HML33735.1 amino acid ABC transporter permease [Sporomusa sph